MIKIYQKKIRNKPFYYLTEQIRIGKKYKKIQVYLGKNIPNDLDKFYNKLEIKEQELVLGNLKEIFVAPNKGIEAEQLEKIEKIRIQQKYFFAKLKPRTLENVWRWFAIEFIFQSNAIEGSRLSRNEVVKIIEGKYIKKSLNKKEVIEVQNSLRAFEFIRSKKFKINQKNIKKLHQIITVNLDVKQGYKKRKIIVNNKETVSPDDVKKELQNLIKHYQENKKIAHRFFEAIDFHVRFERIHPFEDGNGRVGRMILIYMLQQSGYGLILFKLQNRQKYFKSLDHADFGRKTKLYWFVASVYKNTYKLLRSKI